MFIYKYAKYICDEIDPSMVLYSANNRPPNLDDLAEDSPRHMVLTRRFVPIPDWEVQRTPKTVFQIRDPRDILVSEYFSVGFIHGPTHLRPSALELRNRISAGSLSIDEFVRDVALGDRGSFGGPNLHRRLVEDLPRAVEQLSAHDAPYLIVKYEEMIGNFAGWSRQIMEFLEMPHHADKIHAAFQREFDPEIVGRHGEKQSHKRVMLPGDHRRKLKPETIDELNRIFAPFLSEHYPA